MKSLLTSPTVAKKRCTDKALADYWSSDYRPILINTEKPTYAPIVIEDSYLLEGLQSADKIKRIQKQSYKMHPLLPEMEATLMFVYF